MFSSADIGYKKPDRKFFEEVAKRMGDVSKEEVSFWDDDEVNVIAAKKFGLMAEVYVGFDDFKNRMEKLFGD